MANEPVANELTTLTKSFTIIDFIQNNDGARTSEISDALDMPKSTVHRHVTTLVHHGYLCTEGDMFYPGLRFLDHGVYARNRHRAYSVVKTVVDQLAKETGERVQYIVEENSRGIHLYNKVGPRSIQTETRTGKRIYLHSAAAGKAILSELPEERVKEIVDECGLPPVSDSTITTEEEIYNELGIIRERGFAFSDGERIEGLRSVGVPVIGLDEKVIGALSVSGAKNRLSGERYEKGLPERLLGAADEVRLKLKYQ